MLDLASRDLGRDAEPSESLSLEEESVSCELSSSESEEEATVEALNWKRLSID